jgi:hypothetical protein
MLESNEYFNLNKFIYKMDQRNVQNRNQTNVDT